MLSVRPYGVTIDLWALGIFLYHVLRGRTPYEARTLDEVIQNMGHHSIRFSASTSSELVSLIQGLLDWRPETRLGCGLGGVADLRRHPWFEGLDWDAVYFRRHHTVLVPGRGGGDGGNSGGDGGGGSSSAAAGRIRSPPPLGSGGGGDMDTFRGLVTVEPLVSSDPSSGVDAASASAQDELRNFDLNEWGSVSIDTDHDDAGYGDSSLWPLTRPAARLGDDQAVVGFSYTAPVGRPLPPPPPPPLSSASPGTDDMLDEGEDEGSYA